MGTNTSVAGMSGQPQKVHWREWMWTGVGFIGCLDLLLVTTRVNIVELGMLWVLHAVIPATGVTAIVIMGYRRATWRVWELLAFVFPFSCWMLLAEVGNPRPKSLGNLIELMWIGGAIVIAALLRVFVNDKRFKGSPHVIFIGLCIVAIAVYYLTPPLAESSLER